MSIDSRLGRIVGFCFYILFFVTPLLFNPSRFLPSSEVFEINKMMFVYVITALITGVWMARMIVSRKLIFVRTPFDIPILLYLGIQLLATLFSIDRHVSIYGYYSRFHGGLLSTFCYTLLYFAFAANSAFINLRKLFLFILSVGAVVALYGVLEKFGIDEQMWVQDVRARVFSSFGQPNWLAAYLVILSFIAFGFLLIVYRKVGWGKKLITPSFLMYSGMLALFYICLLFTKSRSGFLGFWIPFYIAGIALYLKLDQSQNLVYKIVIVALGILPILFLGVSNYLYFWISVLIEIVFTIILLREYQKFFFFVFLTLAIITFVITTPFDTINSNMTLARFITPTNSTPPPETSPGSTALEFGGITDSANIRRIVWKGAATIIRKYPLLGTGPETFAFAYYKFRPVEHNLTSEWDFLYNRAHNELLNIAATSGLTGLIVYLFYLIAVFFYLIKQAKKAVDGELWSMYLVLALAFLSIHITNFFGFSVVVTGMFLYLIPALAITLPQTKTAASLELKKKVTLKQKILLVGVGVGVVYVIIQVGLMWTADSMYAQADILSRQSLTSDAYTHIQAANFLRPSEPIFYNERATIASTIAFEALKQSDSSRAAAYATDAIDASSKALTTSPQNISFWKTRTKLLFNLSLFEPAFTKSALDAILVARDLAPTNPELAYNAAVIYGRLGKNEEAIELLKQTINLKPDYQDAYTALILFYEEKGNIDLVKKTLEDGLKIFPRDSELLKKSAELP